MNQPLTEEEIQEWVFMMGRTDHERVKNIRSLIWNRRKDKMSPEDLEICRRCVKELEEKIAQSREKQLSKVKRRRVVTVAKPEKVH